IYPILRRLAADGLIVGRRHAQRGKPDRHVYAITPRGLEHLRAWLAVPARPESFRSELLLKLFLGGLVSVETSLGQVREFGKRQDALLQTYAAIERGLRREHGRHPELPYWLMTLRYGQRRAAALRRWADDAVKILERQRRLGRRSRKKEDV